MSDNVADAITMSDEDFLNMDPTSFDVAPEQEQTPVEEVAEELPESDETELFDGEEDEAPEETEQSEVDEEESESEEPTQVEEAEEGEEEQSESGSVDYQAEYEALMKPFKANGTEIQVQNVEEAVKLMQMGANYTKKMTALKPNMKMLKMLENNKLLAEDKLNQLIDVASGDANAIAQLIKEKGIDPLDLNLEGNEYTPKNHTVGDNEVELDDVLSSIQDSATFTDTMNIVSTKWDEASKSRIAAQPALLSTINEHVSNGTYAKVNAEVERQRAFGGLSNLSDIDAYNTVGYQMAQAGKLTAGEPATPKTVSTAPKPKSDALAKAKQKLAPPKPKAKPAPKKEFDPLAMSDEEFEKLFNKQ